MVTLPAHRGRPPLAGLLLLSLALAACGPGADSVASASPDIRGEPIDATPAEVPIGERLSEFFGSPAAAPAAQEESDRELPAAQGEGDPPWIGWDTLSGYDYAVLGLDDLLEIEDTGVVRDLEERFPLEVIELDGQRIRLMGYMIPFEYDADGIASFTLVRDQAQCCFGASPQMNHWISVVMANDGRCEPFELEEIVVTGAFAMGEEVADGYVTSIYRLSAEKVEGSY